MFTYGLMRDMYNYIYILRTDQMNSEFEQIEEEKQMLKDKIVIYNEIITVMKSILLIFQQKQQKDLGKKELLINGLTADMDLDEALALQ